MKTAVFYDFEEEPTGSVSVSGERRLESGIMQPVLEMIDLC